MGFVGGALGAAAGYGLNHEFGKLAAFAIMGAVGLGLSVANDGWKGIITFGVALLGAYLGGKAMGVNIFDFRSGKQKEYSKWFHNQMKNGENYAAAGDVYVYRNNNQGQETIGDLTSGGDAGHVGIELPNGDILTSRPGSGVTIDSPTTLQGQTYDVFRSSGSVDTNLLQNYADHVLGSDYDYGALMGYGSDSNFTCVEVVLGASAASGNSININYTNNYGVITPNNIANSPTFNQSGQ